MIALDNAHEEAAALFYLLSSHVDVAGRDGESEPFPEFASGVRWLTKHMSERLKERANVAGDCVTALMDQVRESKRLTGAKQNN